MQLNKIIPAPAQGPVYASVVIPAYNAAATLPATLDALAGQRGVPGPLDVIVVDDGSTDATATVAAAGGARVLRQPNRGAATARNRGAASARGAFLLFTDSDCVPTPDWVARMLAPFADPTVMGVKGVYRTQQRSIAARYAQLEFEDRYRYQAAGAAIDMVDSYAAAFRRDFFLACGGFDERFWGANTEDAELSYRMAATGARMVFAPDALVYHTHQPTLARYLRLKFGRGYWMLIAFRPHAERAVRDSYRPQVIKLQGVLAVAVLGLAGPALRWRAARWGLGALGAALVASTLPFAVFAARRDPLVGLLAPGISILRGLAIGLGIAAQLLGLGRGLILERDPQGTLREVLAQTATPALDFVEVP